jgi:hypothetical protein
MKYMLLIYSSEEGWTSEEAEQCMAKSRSICHELAKEGKFVTASPLQSIAMATSVRVRQDKRHVTAGPFAETTEQLGGFYIIDVDDLDEAISVASRLPPAKKGTVEIRPLFDLPDMPDMPD